MMGLYIKFFPARIEELLMTHTAVEFCGTIAVEEQERINVLIAFVSLNDRGEENVMEELLSLLHSKLPEHFIPQEIIILDKMPITQSGKIDYRELEKKYNLTKEM